MPESLGWNRGPYVDTFLVCGMSVIGRPRRDERELQRIFVARLAGSHQESQVAVIEKLT